MQEPHKICSLQTAVITAALVGALVGGVAGGTAGFFVSEIGLDNILAGNISWPVTNKNGENSGGQQEATTIVEDSATIDVAEAVSPSVVSIILTKNYDQIESSPFPDFFGFSFPGIEPPSGEQQVGAGTGFIISSDGLILTNRHVVSEEDVEYTVIMNDQTTHNARVVAVDTAFDVALVKIEATNLSALQLGDSDTLKIGQTVLAIGNVLGEYQNSVTRGVTSGTGRTVPVEGDTLEDVLQTDAAINSGNSGGPLLNLSGQVIGINTAVDRGGESIGFAIPINFAKSAVKSYRETGKISRPILGVRYAPIDEDIAAKNSLPYTYGALIVRGDDPTELAVIPGGAADLAGIEENDIILEINGDKVGKEGSLSHLIQKYQVGETVQLLVFHDGQEKNAQVTLQERTE